MGCERVQGSTRRPAPLVLKMLDADIISRLNETVRDREEQVRELLKYEREFQRISAKVGGPDALASLDALEDPRRCCYPISPLLLHPRPHPHPRQQHQKHQHPNKRTHGHSTPWVG
jgi:hypothetical protein